MDCWQLRVDNFTANLEWSLGGGVPHFCEFYLQELDQIPTEDIRGKSPCISRTEKGKGIILKHTRALKKINPQKNYFTRACMCGFYQSLPN